LAAVVSNHPVTSISLACIRVWQLEQQATTLSNLYVPPLAPGMILWHSSKHFFGLLQI